VLQSQRSKQQISDFIFVFFFFCSVVFIQKKRLNMNTSTRNKIAVVTSSADRIGASIVRRLVEDGCTVANRFDRPTSIRTDFRLHSLVWDSGFWDALRWLAVDNTIWCGA
jgi:3-oxoacyl-ACP reductase-like protein